MSIRSRIANIIDPTHKNSRGVLTGREFLRNGGARPMVQDWSHLIMNEEDKYTGLMFAAINKRANLVVRLARENLRTDATKPVMEAAKAKNEPVQHPYLPLIDESLGFSNYDFWFNIPTYLDLRGVFYLGVIRTVSPNRIGEVQEFELLNPYQVKRISRMTDGKVQVGGYREWQGNYYRDWPPQQIIEMRKLNPFKPEDPYSVSDAGKDSQFTLKQAGDYTRHSLASNATSPGIYSTDVILEPDLFEQFVARIKQNQKGEPIIANGAGAVKWDATQIELDKAALDKVTQVNTEPLLAVTATSKTSLGIEQSGVTRDTSKVMSDQLTTDAGIPLLTFIIEALNQDFKKYYPDEYKKNQFKLYIDSPLGKDREAEGKDIENRTKSFDLYIALVSKGYDPGVAARYAAGEITLEELGKPKKDLIPVAPSTEPLPEPKEKQQHVHNSLASSNTNALSPQAAALQNSIEAIEEQVALAVIQKITNAYDNAGDVVDDKTRQEQEQALKTVLEVFYGVVVPLQARAVIQQRANEFGKDASFTVDNTVQEVMRQSAEHAAGSHLDTIVEDLRATVKETVVAEGDITRIAEAVGKKYPKVTETDLRASIHEAAKGGKSDSEIAQALRSKYKDADFEELLEAVRQSALDGAEHDVLVKAIQKSYQQIAKERASVIAKTETNRAFTMSQYEADKKFLEQNGWTSKAYKRWITRSSNPCHFCLAKAAEPPVPFDTPFAKLGDVVEANVNLADGSTSVRKLAITYATIDAGNLHVLCQCGYELIIR